ASIVFLVVSLGKNDSEQANINLTRCSFCHLTSLPTLSFHTCSSSPQNRMCGLLAFLLRSDFSTVSLSRQRSSSAPNFLRASSARKVSLRSSGNCGQPSKSRRVWLSKSYSQLCSSMQSSTPRRCRLANCFAVGRMCCSYRLAQESQAII